MSRCPESAQCLERWVWSSILSEWLVSGFSPTFTFPLSFPAPKSHTGTKAKVSEGWGCDAGLEGVDPLGGPDRGPSFFPFFFLIPFLSGHRGERAHNLTPMRESIVSGGLCYSRMDAGVSGPDKRRGQLGPVIYSRPFHCPSETGARGGGGGGGRASGDDHCLCSARPPL